MSRLFLVLCAIFMQFLLAMGLKNLTEIWINHDHPHRLHKWLEYAEHFMNHLPKPENIDPGSPFRLLEIGVQSGGSVVAWKRYYGEASVVVGIDIDERCQRSHDPEGGIYVEIGSQLNATFLQYVCDKHGPFDVIVDDGGHTDEMITTSLYSLFPRDRCLKRGGVYAIEDVHTMVMKDYMKSPSEVTERIVGRVYRSMHRYWSRAPMQEDLVFMRRVVAMHLYDSLIFLHKGEAKPLTPLNIGTDFFQNVERALNPQGTYYDL